MNLNLEFQTITRQTQSTIFMTYLTQVSDFDSTGSKDGFGSFTQERILCQAVDLNLLEVNIIISQKPINSFTT